VSQYFINLDIDSEERFDLAKFMEYTDNFDPLTSAMLNEVRDMKTVGKFSVQAFAGRPDLISNEIYGSIQYWYLLMEYNNIETVEDLTAEVTLNYPSAEALEDAYFKLRARQVAAL